MDDATDLHVAVPLRKALRQLVELGGALAAAGFVVDGQARRAVLVPAQEAYHLRTMRFHGGAHGMSTP